MTTRPNLESFLPSGNWRDDDAASGHLRTFVTEVLQPVLDLLYDEQDRWEKQIDPDQADEASVDAMLWDLGNPFPSAFNLSIERRRLLVRTLLNAYKTFGTVGGLRAIVRALTSIEIEQVVSPAQRSFWRLGFHALSDEGSPAADPFHTDRILLGPGSALFMRYSFQIEVDQVLTDEQRELITQIVRIVKPAHTHFLGILEPGDLADPDHWQLGSSDLDTETTLH